MPVAPQMLVVLPQCSGRFAEELHAAAMVWGWSVSPLVQNLFAPCGFSVAHSALCKESLQQVKRLNYCIRCTTVHKCLLSCCKSGRENIAETIQIVAL